MLGALALIFRPSAPEQAEGRKPSNVRKISRADAEKSNLSIHEALFYEKLDDGLVKCGLCPSNCILAGGERGNCKVRVNFDGKLYSLVYDRVVSLHYDPMEKKPLFHFLPGEPVLSFATAGCNLACAFCQNWEISQQYPEDVEFKVMTPEEIVGLAKKSGCKAIAYTYNEPSVFFEFMLDCAKLARKNGIKNIWVTSGYINPEPLRELAEYLDAANVDIKGMSAEFMEKYCAGTPEPALATVKILLEKGVHVEMTNLVIPDGNDSDGDLKKLVKWLKENVGEDAVLHFSQFIPKYRMEGAPPTPAETLEKARKIALDAGLKYIYIGNYHSGADDVFENTYCKKCGKLLLARRGYTINWKTYGIVGGKCKYCGEKIYGVWK
jgi:pyruvate formate lyase activating enzyme